MIAISHEEWLRSRGTIEVSDEETGEVLGRAAFDLGRMEWSWKCERAVNGRVQRGWRKTGAKAVAAIEKATKSREEQRG